MHPLTPVECKTCATVCVTGVRCGDAGNPRTWARSCWNRHSGGGMMGSRHAERIPVPPGTLWPPGPISLLEEA